MKQEDFIPGRWYRSTAEANNRGGEIYYGKFLKFRNDAFVASSARVSGEIHDAKYIFSSGYIWELLTDLTEIQEFLPAGHIDKIDKIDSRCTYVDWIFMKSCCNGFISNSSDKSSCDVRYLNGNR